MQSIKKVLMGVAALAALAFGGAQIAGATGGGSGDSNAAKDGHDAPLTGSTAERAKAAALKSTGGGTVESAEASDEDGSAYEVKVDANGKVLEIQLDKSFKILSSKADDDQGEHGADGGDDAVTGATADRAKAAAVKAVGGGTAREVRGENDGDAVYEVEVDSGGKTYEVQLDKAFSVVKQQLDQADGDGETND